MNELLIEVGPGVLLGVTVLLFAGVLGGVRSKQPIDRQRSAEVAVFASLLWVALAFVPLPRFLQSEPAPAILETTILSESQPQSESPRIAAPVLPEDELAHDAVRTDRVERTSIPPIERDVVPASDEAAARSSSVADRPREVTFVAPTRDEPIDWSAVLVALLCAGGILSALWIVAGAWQLRRILRRARPASARVLAQLPVMNDRMRFRVLVADRPCRPFCCGLWRPTIVIPASLCDDVALADVLRHEAAHLRQRDPWSHLLFAIALPLLFFHPLFWWARQRARMAAEVIADDQATRSSSKTDYARHLIDLAERDSARVPVAAIPVFRRPSDFTRRIEMLLKRNDPLSAHSSRSSRAFRWGTTAVMVGVLTGSFGVVASANAQDAQDAPRVRQGDLTRERDALRNQVNMLKQQIAQLRRQIGDTAPDSRVVRVREGDTLIRILKKSGLPTNRRTLAQVRLLNPEMNPERLNVGQGIRLPPGRVSSQISVRDEVEPAPAARRGQGGLSIANAPVPHGGVARLSPPDESSLAPGQSSRLSAPTAPRLSPPVGGQRSPPEVGQLSAPSTAARPPIASGTPAPSPFAPPAIASGVPAPEPFAPVATQSARASSLDLVDRIIEAEGRLEMTEAKLHTVPAQEHAVIAAEMRMYERKLSVLHRVGGGEIDRLRRALEIARADLDRSQKLAKSGYVPQQDVRKAHAAMAELETSIDVLKSVVRSKKQSVRRRGGGK